MSLCLCNYGYVLLIPRGDSSEQSSCDELMEFKQIQTRAQPEEALKHNHSCNDVIASTGYMKKQPLLWTVLVE